MWSNVSNSFILREIRSYRKNTFITVTVLGFVIIAFLFSYAAFGQINSKSSLVSVHILFRHGDRSPTFYFPTDPNNNSWPDGPGELTNKGKLQMYQLGKLIRTYYATFLPDYYNNKHLVVKSSYSSRCQMSASTVLAGLYPPVGNQIWNKDLLWQPIPVNPIPRDRDNLIALKAHCLAFTEEKQKSDEEYLDGLASEQKELFDYLTKHTGKKIANISLVESLYYTLSIEKDNGLTLPSWTDTVFPEPLRSIARTYLSSFSRTDQLKRLQSGPLLGEWLANLESSLNGNAPLMHIYSGHDLTIINLMKTLGLMDSLPWIPDYGASIVLELHEQFSETDKSFFVKLLYFNSSTTQIPTELKLNNCDKQCPINIFKELLKPLVPSDWQKECDHVQ